jgi:hypothetical protein
MRERIQNLFIGRQGMDEFSKFLFWGGCAWLALSCLVTALLGGVLSSLCFFVGSFMLVLGFVRAFSRNLPQREMENNLYLQYLAKKRRERLAAKDRRSQRKDYVFFKCPGCGQYLRVPRGKGKIHINCRCGYTMYRKT